MEAEAEAEVEAEPSKRDSEEVISKDASYVANEIPFIFRTSNLAQSRNYAIWFGTKVPPKRKFN
jgi:hypothetical protein